jgi:exodeoxyribonuclease V beta subunit
MTDAATTVDLDLDLALALPLAGVQLVEASAGTGKTYTIATLFARLVIEAGLPVHQLLAVTFTEAATQALREALRVRLALARDLCERGEDAASDASDAVQALRASLRAALTGGEAAHDLRARLRRAVEQMDLAPIHTIHGFCQRALAEHALEAGQPLVPREVLANDAALRHEIAVEFWRQRSRAPAEAAALLAVWSSPDALATALRDLLPLDALLPAPDPGALAAHAPADAALRAARAALADAFAHGGEAAHALLREACARKQVHATYSKDSAIDPVWEALHAWHGDPLDRDPPHANVGNYGTTHLRKRTLSGKSTPEHPLFDAIDAWLAARTAVHAALASARVATVHAALDFARTRLAALKRERGLLGYDDMIAGVADALAGPHGARFAARLQAQYRVALLDEFQDTDARQWRIFRALFGAPAPSDSGPARALFLIGDPKQAIYRFRGGDVATYLAAQAEAGAPHALRRNFRSRPCALAAVEALFTLRGPGAFAQAGIEFEPVVAGGTCADDALQVDGAIAPGLWMQELATPPDAGIDAARDEATAACVAAIHGLLAAAQAGRARVVDTNGDARPLAPGDVTVLVPRNLDAECMRTALAAAGIPSAAAGRSSLYETDEARHLAWLLAALAAPADDGRLRAALATPLFGLDAAALAAFDTDPEAQRAWQDRALHWQARVRRHGPVALVGAICAEQAPRLRAWPDGERRLSNYLQLAEALQLAAPRAAGPAALRVVLERCIDDADPGNDAELLRLDADAARVRILTQHVSKGLTLGVVFLPYAGIRRGDGKTLKPPMARINAAGGRVGHLYPAKGDAACLEEAREEAAEQIRLLYVALTRARLATWVAWGAVKEAHLSALGWLLHRAPGSGDKVAPLAADAVRAGLRDLQACAADAVAMLPPIAPAPLAALPRLAPAAAVPLSPRPIQRSYAGDWWVHSFSQLAREAGAGGVAAVPEPRGADDELETGPPDASRFAGARFGNALHAALEHVDFAAWHRWRGELPPPHQLAPLLQALREAGYASDADLEEGTPLLTRLVAETLNAPLPEGPCLAQIDPSARVAEMEFHLAFAPVQVDALLAALHAHGVVPARLGFGARARLAGLLTGRIDLVYAVDGRYYVADYKSNRLPDYAAATLARAVRDSEYDLQYVLYALALHRWLRFRLGAAYDPARHFGGVRYLFCRGLDRDAAQGGAGAGVGDAPFPGVHAPDLPVALLDTLDALLRPEAA